MGLGYADARHRYAAQLDRLGLHIQRRRGARRHHAGQALQLAMLGMQAAGYTVILDAQPQLAALGIGQADQCLD
ncbi:hypothetical protein D9M70_380780 [compost metagenome]